MGKRALRLTALKVQKLTEPGMYNDGFGLYLKIGPTGGKSWVYRYKHNKKERHMGLGPVRVVSLQNARNIALRHQQTLLRGEDPLQLRRQAVAQNKLEQSRAKTFDDCFGEFYTCNAKKWNNPKHLEQINSIRERLKKQIGSLPVQDIGIEVVKGVLMPIWEKTPEAADRIRTRIKQVLDFAYVSGYRRENTNPAIWKGVLDKVLPHRSEFAPRENYSSLPYSDLGAFMIKLRAKPDLSARALELTILAATRTSETLEAKWSEFDLAAGVWTIPPERMKAGVEHRVPLCSQAIKLLQELPRLEGSEFLFPGNGKSGHLCNVAMLSLIKKSFELKITTHGFRSTFSTWAREKTDIPRDVVEMALAHTIENKVEAAYMRGTMFLKRKALMDQWAKFCDQPSTEATVVEIQTKLA